MTENEMEESGVESGHDLRSDSDLWLPWERCNCCITALQSRNIFNVTIAPRKPVCETSNTSNASNTHNRHNPTLVTPSHLRCLCLASTTPCQAWKKIWSGNKNKKLCHRHQCCYGISTRIPWESNPLDLGNRWHCWSDYPKLEGGRGGCCWWFAWFCHPLFKLFGHKKPPKM